MDVLIIEKRAIKLPSGAVVTYPAGWSGAVPDEHGAAWVAEGAAQALGSEQLPTTLTAQQTAVLGALANDILAEVGAGGATGDDDGDASFALADLTLEELRAVAAEVGVDVPKKATKPQLVALLEAKSAENAAGDDAVAGGQPERQE